MTLNTIVRLTRAQKNERTVLVGPQILSSFRPCEDRAIRVPKFYNAPRAVQPRIKESRIRDKECDSIQHELPPIPLFYWPPIDPS